MWPSSLTCYLQWLNKCVFVMAKKNPDEPQTACINSILPGTITNASELFCISQKDNAKHFWKHSHPSNSQHIPLQHTCRRKKPQNISEHSYPYCYPCLTAMVPRSSLRSAPTLWSMLWPILWAHTMATNSCPTLCPILWAHTMFTNSCPTLWPSQCMNVAGKYWWFGLLNSNGILRSGTGFLYAIQVRIAAIFHDSYGIAFTFLPPMASSYARRRSKLWI